MRRIFVAVLLILATGCATTPRPAVEAPAVEPAPSAVAPASPAAAPAQEPAPPTGVAAGPATPRPVPRRMLGLADFADTNDEKLLQVYVGMSRLAVERLMDGQQSGAHINPYKRQVLTGVDGKSYEVLFYLTRAPREGRRVTENLLTPVIFRDERVAAIGRYPLKKLRRSACLSRAGVSCP